MSKRLYLVVEANENENVVFEGTADEVSQFVKVHPTQVRRASRFGSLVRRKYRVEPKYEDVFVSKNARKTRLYTSLDAVTGDMVRCTDYEMADLLGVTVQAVRQAFTSGYFLKGRYSICELTYL